MGALIEADGLAAGYGGEAVLRDVAFAAVRGQSIGVLGPNGGGKTTLFRVLVGELRPLAGSLRVSARPAYVAQVERSRLDFPVSALDVALMGALAGGRWWLPPRRADRRAAATALERVGLAAEAQTRFGALSGGQRQRALIARALVQDAPAELLDEPFSGVDAASAERITAVFAELRQEGRAVLVSTHDVESARGFDRVLCLNRRQVAFGAPGECLDRSTLEETYGSEIVVIDQEGGPLRAVTVAHHEH